MTKFEGVRKKEKKISVENSVCAFFGGEEEKNGKSSKIFGKNCFIEPEGGRGKCRVWADYARGVGSVIKGRQ